MSIEITLTPDEFRLAGEVGRKRADMHNSKTRPVHMMAARSELAFAKHLGPDVVERWWKTQAYTPDREKVSLISSDVADYQIRCTDYPNGRLLFTDWRDDPAQRYVLAVANAIDGDTFTFVGWMGGGAIAAIPEHRTYAESKRMDATHAAPQSSLHKMEDLF